MAPEQQHLPDDGTAQADNTITLSISGSGFNYFQFTAVSILVVLAIVHMVCERTLGGNSITKLIGLFDPVKEASITTVFAMLNLLVSSILLAVIYSNERRRVKAWSRYWLVLSLIFFALAVDEVAQVHERGGNVLVKTDAFDTPDDFHPDFVVTGLFAGVVLVVFIPFLRNLDRRTLVRFLLAGGIFVLGALGLELVELVILRQGIDSEGGLLLAIRSIIEEACEMYGIALFNVTLFGLIPQRRIVLS